MAIMQLKPPARLSSPSGSSGSASQKFYGMIILVTTICLPFQKTSFHEIVQFIFPDRPEIIFWKKVLKLKNKSLYYSFHGLLRNKLGQIGVANQFDQPKSIFFCFDDQV